ncbi:hypothetical protein [Krasilnikovia sp. M28-CT-15]|uniref:hypothetical protein n=1 Tax=Krasilnikovia sp. M28-CT-15 TaxID=3373540 RepID=UPI003875C8EE
MHVRGAPLLTRSENPPWGSPLPRDVPGFAQAWSAGRMAVVPPAPPALLPGPSARHKCHLFLVQLVVAALAFGGAIKLANSSGQTWLGAAAFGLGALIFGFMFHGMAAVGRRNVQEFERGYTTLVLTFGTFTWNGNQRWWHADVNIPWDYSGLWVLRDNGTVVSAPVPGREPPGYYPSPHRAGRFELWTGCSWAGQFR